MAAGPPLRQRIVDGGAVGVFGSKCRHRALQHEQRYCTKARANQSFADAHQLSPAVVVGLRVKATSSARRRPTSLQNHGKATRPICKLA
jgi:hypothetical protein